MDGIADHFPAKNALDYRICIYNLEIFLGVTATEEPRTQFPLGSPSFPLFKTTTGAVL